MSVHECLKDGPCIYLKISPSMFTDNRLSLYFLESVKYCVSQKDRCPGIKTNCRPSKVPEFSKLLSIFYRIAFYFPVFLHKTNFSRITFSVVRFVLKRKMRELYFESSESLIQREL